MGTMFSHIRAMQKADLCQVQSIEERVYAFPWSRNGFEQALSSGLSFVFCDQAGRLLGYCFLYPAADQVDLLNVAVSLQSQRQGVAKQGLKQVFARLALDSYQVVFLEVRASHERAQHLYKQLGFRVNGVRKNYYHTPQDNQKEDAILMSLDLLNMNN